jgi:pilus assembly protein Flp/PilA
MIWIALTASLLKVLPSGQRRIPPMLRYRFKSTEALKRLRTDKDGVVSFEYVMVAACIVGAVSAAFGTGAGGAIATALSGGITAITAAFTAAV